MPNEHAQDAPGQNKSFTVVVNGRQRTVNQQHLTYQEVVRLAFPDAQFQENIVYTVTYSFPHGGHDGSMVEGDKVTVKEGMIFNVRRTDKS